ncbi:MAG: HesA/MoeB/ThiF family protein [Chloroflexia bacterium]|nr:HesA/MoeB/ThiF family protein [Chloroflexia bacterium]
MTLSEFLRGLARPADGPEGQETGLVSPAALQRAAQQWGLSLRQVELQALQAGLWPERYWRNRGTLGRQGQLTLLESCVAVIGCGGLGGYVVEGLARSGVGRLVVVDADRFAAHNMNRQRFSSLPGLGRLKVEVAREQVAQMNPAVEFVARPVHATGENLPGLLEQAAVVVDALDNPPDRLVLQDVAARLGLPLVHGAVAGFLGQVTTIFPGDETLSELYGREDVPAHGAELSLGTPVVTPMLVAALQVAQVLNLLLGRGVLCRRRLLYVDLESDLLESFALDSAG